MSLCRRTFDIYRFKSFNSHLHDLKLYVSFATESRGINEKSGQYPLYPGHIKTSYLQKSILGLASGLVLLKDPSRDDLLSALGEASGHKALEKLHKKMLSHDDGIKIMRDKPIISKETVNLGYLRSLSEGTFGKAYSGYLSKQGFDPDSRRPVQFVDDAELAYVMLRYRQTHDFMHILLNMPPNMLGEVVVKWFEYIQTGLPMCFFGGLLGPVRFGPRWRSKYLTTYLPWVVKCGSSANFVMATYYENNWDTPLTELRNRLGIIDPPENMAAFF